MSYKFENAELNSKILEIQTTSISKENKNIVSTKLGE